MDPIDNPGQQWARFTKNEILEANYSTDFCLPFIMWRIVYICVVCIFCTPLYFQPKAMLSISPQSNNNAVLERYATLRCNTNTQSELQCLVGMNAQKPTQQGCEINDDSEQYDRCGELHHFRMLHDIVKQSRCPTHNRNMGDIVGKKNIRAANPFRL